MDETSLMHITCVVHLDKKWQTVIASYAVVWLFQEYIFL